MCRTDIHPEVERALAALLGGMVAALADMYDLDPVAVRIGPVDFGIDDRPVR